MKQITENTKVKINSHLTWREINGEAIILNLENGDYYELDDIGLEIWKKISSKNSIKKIAEDISKKYNEKLTKVSTDIIKFAEDMRKLKIIEIVD